MTKKQDVYKCTVDHHKCTSVKNCTLDRSKLEIEEEGYEVEEILDDKLEKGKKLYFIKWYGYPHSQNTWEPTKNLNCPDLLAEYERKKKENKAQIKNYMYGAIPIPEIPVGRPVLSKDHVLPVPKRTFEPNTPHQEEWIRILSKSRLSMLQSFGYSNVSNL